MGIFHTKKHYHCKRQGEGTEKRMWVSSTPENIIIEGKNNRTRKNGVGIFHTEKHYHCKTRHEILERHNMTGRVSSTPENIIIVRHDTEILEHHDVKDWVSSTPEDIIYEGAFLCRESVNQTLSPWEVVL